MITFIMLLLLNITPLHPKKYENENILAMGNISCFSETNFESVYKFLENEIKQGDKGFYVFEGNKLYVKEGMQIVIKEDSFTLAIIHKKQGVYSLAKVLSDNQHLVKKAHEIFCSILALQGQ